MGPASFYSIYDSVLILIIASIMIVFYRSFLFQTFIYLFIYFYFYLFLFLVALGLCCCARAFSSCSERGLLFVVVHGLLIAVASLVAEHGL